MFRFGSILIFIVALQASAVELLVRISDSASTGNKAEDMAGKSVMGDIVVVRPDGHRWGRKECPPQFMVLKIPKARVEDFREYQTPQMEHETNIVRYRRFKFSLTNAPLAVKRAFTNAVLEVKEDSAITWDQLRTNIVDMSKTAIQR